MKNYSGAVLFIDMLGIGALTQGKIQLTENECKPWKVNAGITEQHQILGAKLLMQFRRSLVHTKKIWPELKMAQLSDCAFIWSKDPVYIANATREMMWHATKSGLLCRAGLAHGQIVEPDRVNLSLGQFILGDAVTRAVNLEGSGKGARVFCDTKIAYEVLKPYPYVKPNLFAALKNPLDGSIIDEFRWYLLPAPIETSHHEITTTTQRSLALIELYTILRYSPHMNWNACTHEGRVQIACTIESVTQPIKNYVKNEDYSFSVEHIIDQIQNNRSASKQTEIMKLFANEITQTLAPRRKKITITLPDFNSGIRQKLATPKKKGTTTVIK